MYHNCHHFTIGLSGWQLAARGVQMAINNRVEEAQDLLRVDSSCIHRQAGLCYLSFIVSWSLNFTSSLPSKASLSYSCLRDINSGLSCFDGEIHKEGKVLDCPTCKYFVLTGVWSGLLEEENGVGGKMRFYHNLRLYDRSIRKILEINFW